MTFAVISVAENREKIIGTIWANGETEAEQIASSLFADRIAPQAGSLAEAERRIVRRAEGREIPFRVQLN